MVSEWNEVKLGELYEFRSGLSKSRSEFGHGYSFLSFKDVFYNYFVPTQLTELVNSTEKERENCSIQRGDVFLTRTSETFDELGMSCVALEDMPNATFNGFCKRLRPKESNSIVPEYAAYYFRSILFRNNVNSMATMSTRASLNNEMLEKLTIILPTEEEQKGIGYILKNIDDKIELNCQMNQTLEQMAQALFKSWFVDFDPVMDKALAAGNPIPDSLKIKAEQRQALGDNCKALPKDIASLFPDAFEFNEELDKWVPEGWKVGTVNEATSLIIDHRGKTPKKLGGDWSEDGYPAVSAKNIKGGRIVNRDQIRFVKEELYHKWMKNELAEGDVLMTSEAPMGEMYFLSREKKYCLSQRMYALRVSKSLSPSYLYCWLQTDIAKSDMEGRASGTTVVGIKQSELRQVKIIFPDSMIVKRFETIVRTKYNRIFDNQVEIETLTKLRDTLLPKLISGEVRVKTNS